MATNFRTYCLQFLSLGCFLLCSSAAHINARTQLPSAMVVGTVYCDACSDQEFSKSKHLISGASVAVECRDAVTSKLSFREEVRTNRHGVFRVRLPAEVSRHAESIKACSAELVKSSHPFCSAASSAASSRELRLKSRRNGVRVFSAGLFTFKPLKRPAHCYQKPMLEHSPGFAVSSLQAGFFFPTPPIPFLPSPPNVGGIPLPPNPLQPPPSLLPPVFPSPPPSVLPPVFPSPPAPSIIPTLPPLFPTPPPPPAFRFPPFPFPPSPFFPGIPPAVPRSPGGN